MSRLDAKQINAELNSLALYFANREIMPDEVAALCASAAGGIIGRNRNAGVIDDATLLPVDPRDYPKITRLWAADSAANPIASLGSGSPCKMDQGTAHAPAFGVGGYAFYGAEFDRQNIVAWALHTMRYWQNPGYCAGGGTGVAGPDKNGNLHGQIRAHGWGLRCLVDALIVDPDNDLLKTMIDQFADALNDSIARTGYPRSGGYYGGKGMAPWQWDFLTFGLGHALNHGFDKFRGAMDTLGGLTVSRINHACPEVASIYEVVAAGPAGIYATWSDMIEASRAKNSQLNAALDAEPGSQALQDVLHGKNSGYGPGDLSGYPKSPTGYPAIYGMALAACVDTGIDGADAAYANWQQRNRADFSWNPQYGVMPW